MIITLQKWLRLLGYKISLNYLREHLQTHPEYPSIFSITETLRAIGIETAAIKVNSDMQSSLPYPSLFHLKENTSERLVLIKGQAQLRKRDISKYWDGVVIIAEKNGQFNNPLRNEKSYSAEVSRKEIGILVLTFLIIAIFSPIVRSNVNLVTGGLTCITLIGLVLGISTLAKSIGAGNMVMEKLCNTGDSQGCSEIQLSNNLKLPFNLTFSDLSVGYFSGVLLFIVANATSATAVASLGFLSAAAIPFTIFSLYYQLFIIRKVCIVCAIIICTIWIQFVLITSAKVEHNYFEVFYSFALVAMCSFLAAFIKYEATVRRRLQSSLTSLAKFKRNKEIFLWQLTKESPIKAPSFENEIIFGTPNAKMNIILVSSPYCPACAYAHELLMEIIKLYPAYLNLRIRFAVNTTKQSDNLEATKYLLEVLRNAETMKITKEKLLENWFENQNLTHFKHLYPVAVGNDINNMLSVHEEWSKSVNVQFTPAVFLNQKEFPKGYYLEDLKDLIGDIIDSELTATVMTANCNKEESALQY